MERPGSFIGKGFFNRPAFVLAGIAALGCLLRTIAAVHNGAFWFDEIITVSIAAKPWGEMWKYLSVENHPPLHYLIVHGWMALFGGSEIAIKLSSVFAGTAGIVATYFFAKELFGTRAGLYAAAACAFSTFHLYYSADARMYPWLYLFGVWSLNAFWRLLHAGGAKITTAWFLATLAALYTHLGAVFLVIIESACLGAIAWHERLRTGKGLAPLRSRALTVRRWCILLAAAFIAWLPWLTFFIREKLVTFNRNAWYFWVETRLPFPIEAARRFFLFDSYTEFLDFFGWIFVAAAFMAALAELRRREDGSFSIRASWDRATAYVVSIFAIPIILGFLAHVWFMKLYMVAAAGAYLLAGKGLGRVSLPHPLPRALLPAAVCTLLITASVGVLVDVRPAWRDVAQYLQAQDGQADAVVILSHSYEVAVRHYYRGTTPVIPFYPMADDTGGDALLRAVRRNWYTMFTGDNIHLLDDLTRGRQKIFLVLIGNFMEAERIAPEWFFAHGWRLKSVERWEDYMVNPEVMFLERITRTSESGIKDSAVSQ